MLKSRRRRTIYKQKQRKPEYKRRFFKSRSKRVGPKIYSRTKSYSSVEKSSTFMPKVYLFGFMLVASAFVYLFFFLDFWQIKSFNFLETDRLNTTRMEEYLEQKLSEKKLWLLPTNHYALLNIRVLEQEMLNRFPEIKEVSITKDFSRVLKISLTKKRPSLIWVQGDPEFIDSEITKNQTETEELKEKLEQLIHFEEDQEDVEVVEGIVENEDTEEEEIETPLTEDEIKELLEDLEKDFKSLEQRKSSVKYFIIDEQGVVGSEVSAETASVGKLPLVYDRSYKDLVNNQHLLTEEFLNEVMKIKSNLKNLLKQEIVSFSIPSLEATELYVKVTEGWFIYLNLKLDTTSVLANFQRIYNDEIQSNPENNIQEYVDLRIGDKVFWY